MLAIMHEVMIHIYRFYNGMNRMDLNYCSASPKRMGEGGGSYLSRVTYGGNLPLAYSIG